MDFVIMGSVCVGVQGSYGARVLERRLAELTMISASVMSEAREEYPSTLSHSHPEHPPSCGDLTTHTSRASDAALRCSS